jgi:hypothetical protein
LKGLPDFDVYDGTSQGRDSATVSICHDE